MNEPLHELKLVGEFVYSQPVAPGAQGAKRLPPGRRKAQVLDRRPSRAHDQSEIVDPADRGWFQPRTCRILPEREIHPLLACPLVRSGWEFDLRVDIPVHSLTLRHRRVRVDDDFGIGIQLFDFPDEAKALRAVAVGILW